MSPYSKLIKDLFGLSDNLRPYAVITVGYPDDRQENKFIDRYDQSRIHNENY